MGEFFRVVRVALAILVLAPAFLRAQIPPEFSVQGRLVDDQGQAVQGPVTLTVRVFDAVEGGSLDFQETDVVALDEDGVFSTRVGDGGGLDPELFAAPRWVSFEVGSSGELAPRRPLTPVPSALHARSSGGLVPTTAIDLGGFALRGLPPPATGDAPVTRNHFDLHALDGSLHFTQGEISISTTQVVGLDAAVSASAHALSTDNPHQVTRDQVGLGSVPDLLPNLSADRAPSTNDDSTAGYAVGSRWVDTASRTAYTLTSHPAPGQAHWAATTFSRFSVVVSPVVTAGGIDPVASGARLEAALAGITDASPERPYRLLIEPGVFQISDGWTLKPDVRVVGAGMGTTILRLEGVLNSGPSAEVEDLSLELFDVPGATISISPGESMEGYRLRVYGNLTQESLGVGITCQGALSLRSSEVVLEGSNRLIGVKVGDPGLPARFSSAGSTIVVSSSDWWADGVYGFPAEVDSRGDRIIASGYRSCGGIRLTGLSEARIVASEVVVDCPFGSGSPSGIGIQGILVDGSTFAELSDITVQVSFDNSSWAQGVDVTVPEFSMVGSSISLEGSGTLFGLRYQSPPSGESSMRISGSRIDVEVDAVSLDMTGMDLDPAGIATVTGSSVLIRDTSPGSQGGPAIGIHVREPATLDGVEVDIESTKSAWGIRADSGLEGFSGGAIRVSGDAGAIGLRLIQGTAQIGSTHFDVVSSASDCVGIEGGTGATVLMAGARLSCRSLGPSGEDAFGFQVDPESAGGSVAIVTGSRIEVSATSGSANLADSTDASQSPDLRVSSSHVIATSRGADVSCTDSVCPP